MKKAFKIFWKNKKNVNWSREKLTAFTVEMNLADHKLMVYVVFFLFFFFCFVFFHGKYSALFS